MVSEAVVTLTTDIVSAFVANNSVPVSEVSNAITNIYGALARLSGSEVEPIKEIKPAVSVRASVKRDHLTCLECGKAFKTLKRHIRSEHDLSPIEYRARFELRADYPMEAPAYSELRSAAAKKLGLGSMDRPKSKR